MGTGGGDRDAALQWLLADREAGSTTSSASSCVQKPHACGTWGHGPAVAWQGWGNGGDDLSGFSQDSMIPKLSTQAQERLQPSLLPADGASGCACAPQAALQGPQSPEQQQQTGNWEHWEQGQPWVQPQAPHRRAKSENTPGAQGIQEQHTPPGNDKTSTEGKGSLLNANPLLLSGCWDQS